jgi:protein-tyrosine-phosphatase
MAEALMRHYHGKRYDIASAGMHPLGRIPENTAGVLEEAGIAVDGLYSKAISELDLDRFSIIVNLTEYPLEGMVPRSFKGRVVTYRVGDPYGRGMESYRRALESIRALVEEMILKWLEG